jgi:hypothetical protein
MILGLPSVTTRPAANIRHGRRPVVVVGSASSAAAAGSLATGARHMVQAR